MVHREFIPKNKKVKGFIVGRHRVTIRPFTGEVMKWLWSQGHQTAIWTSMIQKNADPIIEIIFGSSRGKLVFEWYHEDCVVFTGTGRGKPLMFKPLKKVWDIYPIFGREMVMVDDSEEKLLANPPENNLVVKEFLGDLGDREMLKVKNSKFRDLGPLDQKQLFGKILTKTVPGSHVRLDASAAPEEKAANILLFNFLDMSILVGISEIVEDQDKFLMRVIEVIRTTPVRQTRMLLKFLGFVL